LGAGYTLGAGRVCEVEIFTLQYHFSFKKFPRTPSEKGLAVLGIGSLLINEIVIGENLQAFEKSAAEKIGGQKKLIF
jgi:hypothetical protein